MDFDVNKKTKKKKERDDEMKKRDVTKKNTLGRMRKWGKWPKK